MMMTDKEIYKSYQQASKKRTQIRILSELNACTKQEIQEIIDRMEEEMTKRPGRPKKEKAAGIPEAVKEAVRARVMQLELKTTELKKMIDNHTTAFDSMMQEWSELKEWQQEHDTEPGGQAI